MVRRREEERNLCKLKYEIEQNLYITDESGVYYEQNIFAIKMLYSPIDNNIICKKMEEQYFILNGNLIYMVMVAIVIMI